MASAGGRTAGGAACEGSEARTVAEPDGKIVREASGGLSGGARAIGGRIAAPPAGVEGGVHSGGAIAMGGTRLTAGSHVQSADQTESSRQSELAPSESPMKTTTGTCVCCGGRRGRRTLFCEASSETTAAGKNFALLSRRLFWRNHQPVSRRAGEQSARPFTRYSAPLPPSLLAALLRERPPKATTAATPRSLPPLAVDRVEWVRWKRRRYQKTPVKVNPAGGIALAVPHGRSRDTGRRHAADGGYACQGGCGAVDGDGARADRGACHGRVEVHRPRLS